MSAHDKSDDGRLGRLSTRSLSFGLSLVPGLFPVYQVGAGKGRKSRRFDDLLLEPDQHKVGDVPMKSPSSAIVDLLIVRPASMERRWLRLFVPESSSERLRGDSVHV